MTLEKQIIEKSKKFNYLNKSLFIDLALKVGLLEDALEEIRFNPKIDIKVRQLANRVLNNVRKEKNTLKQTEEENNK